MTERGDTPTTGDEAVETPARKRRFPVKSVIALVIIVVVGLPVFSTLQPRYYERYSDLAPRMEGWRTSTHARISCGECHIEPGVAGFLTFAANSIPAFYEQLLKGPHTTNLLKAPDRKACQKCHTSYREVSTSGDLFIPHKAHVEVLELNCTTCHEDLVHKLTDRGFNTPRMTGCLERCHDGEQATSECTKCHTRKQVPESHRSKDWLRVHSQKTEEIDCSECHAWSPDFCGECHSKKPASHAGNWKKEHQYPAIDRGTKRCMTCHQEEFCKQCHD